MEECDEIINVIVSALATLVAAFAGAAFAFYLQEKKERLKEEERRISAINQALFALIQQFGVLRQMKEEIEPLKDDNLRYVKVPAQITNDFDDVRIRIETLNFLLDSHPNLLMEILAEQAKFEMALKTVKARAEHHFNLLQPEFNRLIIETGGQFRESDLGHIGRISKQDTDQMYEIVYGAHDSVLAVFKEFRAYAKQTYPHVIFVNLTFVNLDEPHSSMGSEPE
jgi:hypothetical protein